MILDLCRSVILVLCCSGAVSCFSQRPAKNDFTSASQDQNIISDAHFRNGFSLLGTRSIDTGGKVFDTLNFDQGPGIAPHWRLAQWGTKHSLQGAKLEVIASGKFRYANEAKSVVVDTERGQLTLAAYASKEYTQPRRINEEWPHLLVEQYFVQQPRIEELQEVRLKMRVRVPQFEDHMTSSSSDVGLHAAQLQVYLMVQNRDTSSSAFGDYFWFGVGLFDNREPVPKEMYHKDGGKADTTHKFIYVMPASAYMARGLGDGKWQDIDVNILPYITRAQELAFTAGFLQGSAPMQLALTSINIGWELPGTYDVKAEISNLELRAVR